LYSEQPIRLSNKKTSLEPNLKGGFLFGPYVIIYFSSRKPSIPDSAYLIKVISGQSGYHLNELAHMTLSYKLLCTHTLYLKIIIHGQKEKEKILTEI
jgi:hypothetical protein